MPDPTMLPVLVILLAVASVSDATQHRIPNPLVVGVAATGALAQLLRGGPVALGGSVLAVAVVGALFWPAWRRVWLGGGDLKFAAAAAAWVGLARLPGYLLASGVALGAMAVVGYALSSPAVRGEVLRNLVFAARGRPDAAPIGPAPGRVRLPAGVAFSVGALAALVIGRT